MKKLWEKFDSLKSNTSFYPDTPVSPTGPVGASVVTQSSEQAPFTSENVRSILAT